MTGPEHSAANELVRVTFFTCSGGDVVQAKLVAEDRHLRLSGSARSGCFS